MSESDFDINGVAIDDTFAEAFPMIGARIVITARSPEWAEIAARTMTGFATSVIACGVEAGIDRILEPEETPDGRPGVAVLMFSMDLKTLEKQLHDRTGQCVLTCPGTACFSGADGEKRLTIGGYLRYFGDGWQFAKKFTDTRYWRIPVMDGEFVVEHDTGLIEDCVGGGNILILGQTYDGVLAAAERAVVAMRNVEGVVMPFPGGIVRSGSKVGSKYAGQPASTNDAYCPTLKGAVDTRLDPDTEAVLEIVIDGVSPQAVSAATRAGIEAVCDGGADAGVTRIAAGNYGGNLGPHHFHLREIMR